MTSVSPAENLKRISLGKKATRTVTAPSLSVRQHDKESKASDQAQRPLANRYASQDNGLSPFTSSGYLSPRLKSSSSTCMRDVKEVFTIRQIMRDTLEVRRKPKSVDSKMVIQRQQHKKEYLRSWSRERIIVTEEIIYPVTSLTITSASSSFSSITGPQSKPYFPLEKYNTSGRSLPLPSVIMVGVLPSHVADHGSHVLVTTTSNGRVSLEKDRKSRLEKQISEPESSTLLFSDLSSASSAEHARVIEVRKASGSLLLSRKILPQTLMQRPNSTALKRSISPHFPTTEYALMEHADEDQLVQNIPPLRPVEKAKSLEVTSEENQKRNPVQQRVSIMESSNLIRKVFNSPLHNPPQKAHTTSSQEQQPTAQMLTTSDLPPSSLPPDYHSVLSDQHEVTIQEDEDLRSTSTSVYETARSSVSLSPSREEFLPSPAQTPTLYLAHKHCYHRQQMQQNEQEREGEGETMTTVIDKLDAATKTVIPTSPVYFRTIVRRDHAGYGLTVCGTNPVTVRNIREGGTAERAGLRPGDEIVKVNGVNVEEMDHQEVVERIRAKATVCFMLRRIRPSRRYLASTTGEGVETNQLSHRRYQKRRLHRETIGSSSGGGTAAVVNRRRPNNIVAVSRQGFQREQSLSPPSYSGRTDTDGDETMRGGSGEAWGSSSGGYDWADEDANLSTVADGGSSADLPPLHPASASSSLGSGRGTFGLATISDTSVITGTNLTRSRGRMGAADRPFSPAFTNHNRRPLSLVEAPVTRSFSITIANNNLSNNVYQTLASPKKNKQKHNHATSAAQNAATSLPSGHYLGRVLNEVDSGDEKVQEEICALASRFQSAFSVLNSPSLSAILLNYLLVQNHDLAPTLFYLVAKHYHWMQTHSKEVAKDYQRVLMEIYTTFLHEKSPLCVKVDTQSIQQMEGTISSSETATIFESCCTVVLPQIQVQVDKLNKDIRHGLDTWKPSSSFDLSSLRLDEEELSTYEMIMIPRVNELQRIIAGQALQTGSHLSATSSLITAASAVVTWVSSTAIATETPREQIASALCASLVSAYRYFAASTAFTASSPLQADTPTRDSAIGLAPTCPDTPALPQHSFRKNSFAKSIENLAAASTQISGGTSLSSTSLSGSMSSGLATISAINWDKLPSFNAKLKSRSSNAMFGSRKTRHSQKGHSLQERIFERIAECAVCGGLVWGLAPQGLSCQACDVSVHHRCRAGLQESCAKDKELCVASRCSVLNVGLSTSPTISSITTASSFPRWGMLNSGAYLPELANVSVTQGNTGGTGGDREGSGGSSGLANFTEDMLHCRSSSYNELIDKCASCSPLRNHSTSPPDMVVSSVIDEEVKVKRSNSGFGHVHLVSSQAGITSPEINLRYVRNVKQKLDNHSLGGTGMALSKNTASLMQLPIMIDRDLKRSTGSQNSSSSALISAAANVPELLPTWTGDPEMDASESFEAANELRIHFPNYEIPTNGLRLQDHVRTLVLLEFHQKVCYMVCYLKQFEYLLLRRWPKEHQHLADLMSLDRIPCLIRLFRSLVHTIEQTVEPQGYGKMAEAVLAWLSEDDEANLKAWTRDCQALSCTNMLDSVKAMVRDYARKHPDIQVILETRFNKFVLIEGLSQVRTLYFNLPLISNNIMKDLERKTSNYRAEAKIWREIHSKLASIPHSIDKICMPLVKMINDGHFFSTVDKSEQLTRHQAQGGILPFADLLLQFPRTLFRFWVIDHAEIAVDKLTFTSDNKVNYDYMKERTDVLAVLLDSALVLLVKDGGRYSLRPFKPSKEPSMENLATSTWNAASLSSTQFTVVPNLLGHTMKLSPVFSTDSVFASLGEQIGQEYMLNMIFKDQAILLRLSFASKETREKWLNILKGREQISAQQRLTVVKGHDSLSSVSMRSDDQKIGSEYLKAIRTSVETLQSNANFNDLEQMANPNLPIRPSSAEPLEKQVAHFSEKISEVKQDLQALVQSISNSRSSNVDEFLEKMSLKSGDTLFEPNSELIISELLLTEKWLKFVAEHLRQLSRGPKWFGGKRAGATVVATASNLVLTTASKRVHQRSKSVVVPVVLIGLMSRRRRFKNPRGLIHPDCLEQASPKISSGEFEEVMPIEGRKTSEIEYEESDMKARGRNQIINIIYDLKKQVENTVLVASCALGNLEAQERRDPKPDDDQSEAFMDANSLPPSSHSSSSITEIEKTLVNDFKRVQEMSLEEFLLGDCEVEEKDRNFNGVGGQGLLEREECAEISLVGHVSRLEEALRVLHLPVAKEEERNGNVDDLYEDEVRMVALQLIDDTIDPARSYEVDLAMIANDLTISAVASAITQVMGDRHGDSELACAMDSGISSVEIPDHLSSGDDEPTVTGSKSHLVPIPIAISQPMNQLSDLDKLDLSQPPLLIGFTLGHNYSQKSTNPSGCLDLSDEFVQHDWI
ncbi:hypothetical protein TcWFU_008386 [Taenia crassiceps]|uniref:Uncharacterized protein n=1 Tax=Taenia crassiceps TaxID=6207 RepID=A0ABR4QMD9_9CEST